MPRVSLYTPEDLADVERVFRSRDLGLDPSQYPLPDFRDPLIRSNIVVRTNDGKFIGQAYSRALVEVSLILDPTTGTNKERMKALWALHEGTRRDLQERGYDRAVAFLAPKPEGFQEILERHGWEPEKDRRTVTYNF
jgi:hypothetical protein